MGCTAFVISTSQQFMKNSDGDWVEITTKTSGGSEDLGDGIYDGGNIDDSDPTQEDKVDALAAQITELKNNMVSKDGANATGTWNINISGNVEPQSFSGDIDTITTPGYYLVTDGTNTPEEGVYIIVNYKIDSDNIRQCALGANSIYIRDYAATEWQSWIKIQGENM